MRYALLTLGAALAIRLVMLMGVGRSPVAGLASLLVVGGLLIGIAFRRNWARRTLGVLTVLSLIVTLPVLLFQLSLSQRIPIIALAQLIPLATLTQMILEGTGLVLLFSPPAQTWFATHTSASPAA